MFEYLINQVLPFLLLVLTVLGPFIYFIVIIEDLDYQVKDFLFPFILSTGIIYLLYHFEMFLMDFHVLFFYFWPIIFFFTGIKLMLVKYDKNESGIEFINFSFLFGLGHIAYFFFFEEISHPLNAVSEINNIITAEHFILFILFAFLLVLFFIFKIILLKRAIKIDKRREKEKIQKLKEKNRKKL